ncbi:MAG: hypothetical protein Q8K60_02790 [Parachlamydiaceae bacterium]|nr:hypothetical protein [Parachlamydiaceae bacterium]
MISKDFCTSFVSNQIILNTASQKQILLTSIVMAALSRIAPAITRSNWHNEGESWYGGRWFAIKTTIFFRIGLEVGLLHCLKKRGSFSHSLKSTALFSILSRVIIGTFLLEPIIRTISSNLFNEKKFKWFEDKFLISPEQKNFEVLFGGKVNAGKRTLITMPLPATPLLFIPLPIQGALLSSFLLICKESMYGPSPVIVRLAVRLFSVGI